jgi:hypothetical protein
MFWHGGIHYVFGAGARVCPGELFAIERSRIFFAVLLWGYEIFPEGEIDLSVETGVEEEVLVVFVEEFQGL